MLTTTITSESITPAVCMMAVSGVARGRRGASTNVVPLRHGTNKIEEPC
jgi:hypothetical protein